MKEFAAEMGVTYWNLKDWKRRYRSPPFPPLPAASYAVEIKGYQGDQTSAIEA